jgi:nitroimidazol reductase NimA-like FMN-containing flavoprotein (pyridoxamine 5'-phosphate oxidase superfamily)
MRRREKEIADRAEIDAVIKGSEVCRLAFAVKDQPYLVPVSFGYDGQTIYFHTAATGKKIDCIAANNRVCFELERGVQLLPGSDKPCTWSFAFESVIGHGRVSELVTTDQKRHGLDQIMRHYTGTSWSYDPAALDSTRVWKITIESMTGKRSQPKQD